MKIRLLLSSALALAAVAWPSDARACGCFTPSDPSLPIVQAGERILFAMSGGQVTAHIQIQYQGAADDFAWLVPVPSLPTLQLGTDELFTQLATRTQPTYELQAVYKGTCNFGSAVAAPGATGGFGGGGAGGSNGGASGGGGVLVYQASIGPYDYAILHADSQDELMSWLATNHYVVPTGTSDAVSGYVHPGAYFLALKLEKSDDSGNLQPIVVQYASELPAIPIVLTSLAANPNMGIQVWMLGAGRAIPRNYYHTVINDAKLDWLGGAQNYDDVIIASVGEAPGEHSFVTEYAGPSTPMRDVLAPPSRFGTQSELAAQATDVSFVEYVVQHDFPFTSATTGVLQQYIPEPQPLVADGVSAQQFYGSIAYYLGDFRQMYPSYFDGWSENFQPAMMASDLFARVVAPSQAANALFAANPYLTRLYTTLSPKDMNKDPVFSFNDGLPGYSNVHTGTITYFCGNTPGAGYSSVAEVPAELRTEEGWVVDYPSGTGAVHFTPPGGPSSERTEILYEEGSPVVVSDNASSIAHALGGGGCGVGFGARATRDVAGVTLLGLVLASLIVRRRPR